MRWAVLLFAAVISATYACADNSAFDVMVGAWALERYRSGSGSTTRGGPFVAVDLRLPRRTVAYEAAISYRGYNGVQTDASALGLENRLPIYFTGEPLRVYAAPSLGFWQFKYGLDAPPAYATSDSDFALSLGGNLGLRVVAGGKGSYVDVSYGYQGTKVTGPGGFFGSRRILRAKGNIGITSQVGFGIEAGTVEEGWSFGTTTGSGYYRSYESLSTLYAGSPYIMLGPHFSF
jgi:hypothetical protein